MALSKLDVSNSEIAFAGKSDKDLQKAAWLFGLMNKPWLVNIGSKVGLWAIKANVPTVEPIVKATIFEQFCGGTTLADCQTNIDKLYEQQVQVVLDYGAEAKTAAADLDNTRDLLIEALKFAATNESVPIVTLKVTGLARFELLEKIQAKKESLTTLEVEEFNAALQRLKAISEVAYEHKVALFIDAEESWIQDTIDGIVTQMMQEYNKEQVIVYNTFQMYRHDRLPYLKAAYKEARKNKYLLGAKIVRGAYMQKERERAEEMGYASPIQVDKAATDADYNAAIRFCVKHYEHIASCNASHNEESNLLQTQLMEKMEIPRDHPHLNFCQLYGMSELLTFNLAAVGYNAAKYMPYGAIKDVVPYLIRRAQENTSVTGDMSRELSMIMKEIERRKTNQADR